MPNLGPFPNYVTVKSNVRYTIGKPLLTVATQIDAVSIRYGRVPSIFVHSLARDQYGAEVAFRIAKDIVDNFSDT